MSFPVCRPGSAEGTWGSACPLRPWLKHRGKHGFHEGQTRRFRQHYPGRRVGSPLIPRLPACRAHVAGQRLGRDTGVCPSRGTMVVTLRQTWSPRRANASIPAALPGPGHRLFVDTGRACLPCLVCRPASAEGTWGSCPSLATMVEIPRQRPSSPRANASIRAALSGPACRLSVDTTRACLPCPCRRAAASEWTRGSLVTMVKTPRQTRSSQRANASIPALPGPGCQPSVDTGCACLPCLVRRPGSAEGMWGSAHPL